MCLGIPGRVVDLIEGCAGQLVLVDVQGAVRKVNAGMLEQPPHPGDWVLLHLGFAVSVIDGAQARRALSGLELMGRPLGEGEGDSDRDSDSDSEWSIAGPATARGAKRSTEPRNVTEAGQS